MSRARTRATLSATLTAAGAAFGFVRFVPRLARAVFTGPADRARTAEILRGGLDEPAADPPASVSGPVTVFVVAGEPSGDEHASDLALALRARCPGVRIVGIGGPAMAAAGVELTADLVSDPVMGVWPVVARTPDFFKLYRDILVRLEEDPPDVVVGVDYPGLNLRLARAARARAVPFVTYIAPQVWAWAPWRARAFARAVTRMICILPFERAVFARAGADAVYVGHPLFERLRRRGSDAVYAASLREGLGAAPLVALLPGSRRAEVRDNLPILAAAAERVARERPGARFVVPLAAERLRETIASALPPGLDVRVAPPQRSDDAMAAADAAISVSGTATLHLVAHGIPCVVVYRASAAGRLLSRLLLVCPWFALPNLLSGAQVVPEFLASPRDAPRIGDALLRLLPGGPDREGAITAMAAIRTRVGVDGVPDRAAGWILASVRQPEPSRARQRA